MRAAGRITKDGEEFFSSEGRGVVRIYRKNIRYYINIIRSNVDLYHIAKTYRSLTEFRKAQEIYNKSKFYDDFISSIGLAAEKVIGPIMMGIKSKKDLKNIRKFFELEMECIIALDKIVDKRMGILSKASRENSVIQAGELVVDNMREKIETGSPVSYLLTDRIDSLEMHGKSIEDPMSYIDLKAKEILIYL